MLSIPFGRTNLQTSPLGFGAGEIGDRSLDEKAVGHLLGTALDNGVVFIDTARGYDMSEQRIGTHISHRREVFILSTKVGYGVDGVENWTAEAVTRGIDEALFTMKTDCIDIVHLHSCDQDILEAGDCFKALESAKSEGKIRFSAYSGENEPLAWAVQANCFDVIQTSLNICDQSDLDTSIAQANAQNMGIIAKRPLANAPWRFKTQPVGHYAEAYWLRLQAMDIDLGAEPHETALRFAAFHTGAQVCIAGTTNPNHLMANIKAIEKGPLELHVADSIRTAFKKCGADWKGEV